MTNSKFDFMPMEILFIDSVVTGPGNMQNKHINTSANLIILEGVSFPIGKFLGKKKFNHQCCFTILNYMYFL